MLANWHLTYTISKYSQACWLTGYIFGSVDFPTLNGVISIKEEALFKSVGAIETLVCASCGLTQMCWGGFGCHSPQNSTTPAGPGLLPPTQTPGESCNTPSLIIFNQGADDETPRGRLEDAFWRQMRQRESPQALQLPTSLPGQLLPQGWVGDVSVSWLLTQKFWLWRTHRFPGMSMILWPDPTQPPCKKPAESLF